MDALHWRRTTGVGIDHRAGDALARRIVVLLAVLLASGSTLLLPPASGASAAAAAIDKPELQTLVQFDFDPPMWGMPEATAWTHMDFSIARVLAGHSFDTSVGLCTSTGGPFLIVVVSGELDIVPNGPAIVYPADRTQQPRPIDPGESASLGPHAAIAFSIADAAAGTSSGAEPLIALFGLTGSEDFCVSGAFSSPFDVAHLDFQYIDGMPVLPTAEATVSIRHVELLPFDSWVFEPDETQHTLPAVDPYLMQGLQISDGRLAGWSPNTETIPVYGSTALMYPERGPRTLFNLGEEPIDIYFLVVEPYPALATPAS